MTNISKKVTLSVVLITAVSSYIFFLGLGTFALTDPDETFYAQTAREMVQRNEWTTPYLFAKPQYEKPIMFYWLVAISYKIFGVNEFSARLPSAVMGLIGVIFVYLLGALLYSRRTGLLSALVMATSAEYVVLSRACVTDMTLFAFMAGGAFFFLSGYLRGVKMHYMISAAFFALAVLTKGPIAILLPGLIFLIFLIFAEDFKSVAKIPFAICLIIFMAIAAPWYVTMYKLHGKEFIDAFFGFHNVTRFLQAEHKIGSEFYYNIPIVFGGLLPWSIFLPFGFWRAFKKSASGDDREKKASIFILTWFSVIFIFFSISSTKLPTYIFPAFLSLAVITGELWDKLLDNKASSAFTKGIRVYYYCLLTCFFIAILGGLFYIYLDFPEILKGVFISAVPAALFLAASIVTISKNKYKATFVMMALSVTVLLLPIGKFVLPVVERFEASKEAAQELKKLVRPGEKVGSESNFRAGLAFYVDIYPVNVDRHEILTQLLSSDKRVWCVMKEKNQRGLYEIDEGSRFDTPTYLIYSVGKRAIVTNKIPAGTPYIIKMERMGK